LKTSYFAKYKGKKGVSIARGTPKWFEDPTESELFPSWEMIHGIKKGFITPSEYESMYREVILYRLNPLEIYEVHKESVLLCWEKIGEFCHRRIVASWIEEETGNVVEEYGVWKL